MPAFGWKVSRLAAQNDVILLHLPQFDAAGVAIRGRLYGKPTVVLYHSDLLLPPGIVNRFVNIIVNIVNHITATFADKIVAYTDDFARHSVYLSRFAKKVEVILPNVTLPKPESSAVETFQRHHKPSGSKTIAMVTRLASEKGVEVLLDALPTIFAKHPNAKILYAGQYLGVWGEEDYANRLMPRIQQYQFSGQWEFLGVLSLEELAVFYPAVDVLVVPSLNSTETFGFVQIEAMMNGVPCVASNLPGVRQPVKLTGMGKIIPVGDSQALAEAIIDILDHPTHFHGDPEKVTQTFHPDTNAEAFERLFTNLIQQKRSRK
jgi:glycosyltransferase involved in cell wall biosynthesis